MKSRAVPVPHQPPDFGTGFGCIRERALTIRKRHFLLCSEIFLQQRMAECLDLEGTVEPDAWLCTKIQVLFRMYSQQTQLSPRWLPFQPLFPSSSEAAGAVISAGSEIALRKTRASAPKIHKATKIPPRHRAALGFVFWQCGVSLQRAAPNASVNATAPLLSAALCCALLVVWMVHV